MKYRYACLHRPPLFGSAPKGWSYAEFPWDARSVPPGYSRSKYRHGVIEYDRKLTEDEVRTYELKLLESEEST